MALSGRAEMIFRPDLKALGGGDRGGGSGNRAPALPTHGTMLVILAGGLLEPLDDAVHVKGVLADAMHYESGAWVMGELEGRRDVLSGQPSPG